LDFEKIVAEIAPETSIQMSEIDKLGKRGNNNIPILVAEDSVLLSKMITEALHKSGYAKVTTFPNGQELWDFLRRHKSVNDVDDVAGIVITDIEMPQMDGHRLTKLIKDDKELQHIPVIIFSSLITEEMRIKGEQLGADEQMSKPEIGRLVEVIDRLSKQKDS
jgi:two-component system chemotaxis response regulator CheV